MRCKDCGSTNVQIITTQQSGYSYGKGLVGTMVFGPIGAVAGVGGKNKTTSKYHCMSCGCVGSFDWVVMDPETEGRLNFALSHNDVEKLADFKRRYRNIEWNCSFPSSNGSNTYVTIPNNETIIDSRAFKNRRSLTSVRIPDSLTIIDSEAFRDCINLTSVTIGKNITKIGNSAFKGCRKLTNIIIPDAITTIDSNAFYGCKSLTSVTIGKNVTKIGNSAFKGCRGIINITIPDSVTSIGNNAFMDCPNLKSVAFENPRGWKSKDGKFDEAILSDPTKAAEYLTKTHYDHSWRRK